MMGKKYGEGNKELPKHNTLSNMVEALLWDGQVLPVTIVCWWPNSW